MDVRFLVHRNGKFTLKDASAYDILFFGIKGKEKENEICEIIF